MTVDEGLVARVAKQAGCSKALVRTVIKAFFKFRADAIRTAFEERGGQWGRPPSVDGATCRRAVVLRKRGESLRAITRALGVPRSTLGRLLEKR